MRHPTSKVEQARYLRRTQGLSLGELASNLGVPRTTVYYWIKNLPVGDVVKNPAERSERQKANQRAATSAMQAKYAAIRQQAYQSTMVRADELLQDQAVRDFVVLYLAEGYRKDRNCVAFSNSNPCMIRFAHDCIRKLSTNPHLVYSFQYHADQDPETLKAFWADYLGIDAGSVAAIPKTNSGQLKGRRFACEYGVFQIQVGDTVFRAQLQALMDTVQEQWAGVDRA